MSAKYPCPCCGYLTYSVPPDGDFSICPVCFWEDDPVQSKDPEYSGGANSVSLNEARANFKKLGASAPTLREFVRKPHPDEIP